VHLRLVEPSTRLDSPRSASWRTCRGLSACHGGSSSPFVGLLGTVLGIITAFKLMASPARAVSLPCPPALPSAEHDSAACWSRFPHDDVQLLTNRVEEDELDIADASTSW